MTRLCEHFKPQKHEVTKHNPTIKVRRSISMFFQCIKDDMMLYYVIVGYAIQKQAKFRLVSFQGTGTQEWPMPLPVCGHDTDIWNFPFDQMTDDGCVIMEKFLASLGLMESGVGCIFQVPATMVVNKQTRNEDVVRNRMPWWDHTKMASGTTCVIDLPVMRKEMSLEYFVDSDLEKCEECMFLNRKLGNPDNIWADHAGGFFYGLKVVPDRNGDVVEAKKLCGDQDGNKFWRYRDAPQVRVGFEGWSKADFAWHMDGFRCVAGVGVRMPATAGDLIFPMYMHMLQP